MSFLQKARLILHVFCSITLRVGGKDVISPHFLFFSKTFLFFLLCDSHMNNVHVVKEEKLPLKKHTRFAIWVVLLENKIYWSYATRNVFPWKTLIRNSIIFLKWEFFSILFELFISRLYGFFDNNDFYDLSFSFDTTPRCSRLF